MSGVGAEQLQAFDVGRTHSLAHSRIRMHAHRYDTVAQGPGWALEGHSGAEWRLQSKPYLLHVPHATAPPESGSSTSAARAAAHGAEPTSRPVNTLESLLLRSGPCACIIGMACVCDATLKYTWHSYTCLCKVHMPCQSGVYLREASHDRCLA